METRALNSEVLAIRKKSSCLYSKSRHFRFPHFLRLSSSSRLSSQRSQFPVPSSQFPVRVSLLKARASIGSAPCHAHSPSYHA